MQPNIHNLSRPLGAQGNPFVERMVIDPYTGQAYTYFMGQGDMQRFDPSLGQVIEAGLPQSNYARQTNAPGWDAQYRSESQRLQQAVAQNRAAAERFLAGGQQPRQLPQYNDITGAFIGDPANDPRNQQQGEPQMAGESYNWMNNRQPTNGLRGPVSTEMMRLRMQALGTPRTQAPQQPKNTGMTPEYLANPYAQSQETLQATGPQYGQSFGWPGDIANSLPSTDWRSPGYAEQPQQQSFGRPNQGMQPNAGGGRSFGRMTPGGGQQHVTQQQGGFGQQGQGGQGGGIAPPFRYGGSGGVQQVGQYPGLTGGGVPQYSSGWGASGGMQQSGGMSFNQGQQYGQPQQYRFGSVNGVPFGQAPPPGVMQGFGGQPQMQGSPWGGGGGTATMGGLAAPIFAPGTNIGGRQDAFGRPATQAGGGGGQAVRGGYTQQPWGSMVR